MKPTEELTEFKIIWCIAVALALAVLFMDIFIWRPN
jgi:hypothetical protein